jgi:hypothetical protein
VSKPPSWAGLDDDFDASVDAIVGAERFGFFRAILARAILTVVEEKKLSERFASQCEAKKAAPGCRGANSRLAFLS